MRSCWIVLAVVACSNVAVKAATPAPERWEKSPARAVLLGRHIPADRAAWRHDVRLALHNRRDEPVWLVLRAHPDRPLAATGHFEKENIGHPFLKKVHEGEAGSVVELYFFARDGFTAFYLGPGARVDLARFPLFAFEHVHEMEVWEVRDLKVNGVDSLADWLPFDAQCKQAVQVDDSTKTKWEALEEGPGSSPQSVGAIDADVIRRWVLPLR